MISFPSSSNSSVYSSSDDAIKILFINVEDKNSVADLQYESVKVNNINAFTLASTCINVDLI